MSCPVSIPLFLAEHTWFVVNKKGTITRWEVFHFIGKGEEIYIRKDFFPPFSGLRVINFIKKYLWKGRMLSMIEDELAERVIEVLEKSMNTYPYKKKYAFFGPNSNTYTAWVLNQFPEWQVKLPWNAIGKNYK